MRQSVSSRHDVEGHHDHAAPGSTAVLDDLFATRLAPSWSLSDDGCAMERRVAFDTPPMTPACSYLTPPSLPGIYHPSAAAAVAAVGDPRYCAPATHIDVDATPPYFVGDRRLPAEVCDRGVYGGGMSMRYGDIKPAVTDSGVPGPSPSICSAGDDRDCSMRRSVLMSGDALLRTPANLALPPPSMFAWRNRQASYSQSVADHDPVPMFPSYYSNIVVDQPSCRSPVGADRKFVFL